MCGGKKVGSAMGRYGAINICIGCKSLNIMHLWIVPLFPMFPCSNVPGVRIVPIPVCIRNMGVQSV